MSKWFDDEKRVWSGIELESLQDIDCRDLEGDENELLVKKSKLLHLKSRLISDCYSEVEEDKLLEVLVQLFDKDKVLEVEIQSLQEENTSLKSRLTELENTFYGSDDEA